MVFLHPATKVLLLVSMIALQLFRESYAKLSVSTMMDVRLVQFLKRFPPMLVTLLGMVMEVRPLQLQKAREPMVVTLLGIITDVSLLQSLKALPSIYLTK